VTMNICVLCMMGSEGSWVSLGWHRQDGQNGLLCCNFSAALYGVTNLWNHTVTLHWGTEMFSYSTTEQHWVINMVSRMTECFKLSRYWHILHRETEFKTLGIELNTLASIGGSNIKVKWDPESRFRKHPQGEQRTGEHLKSVHEL